MELIIYLFLLYLVASILVSKEGVKHQIGGINAFILSLFLTPIVAIIIVSLSPRNLSITHYIKQNDCTECNEETNTNTVDADACDEHSYWVKV